MNRLYKISAFLIIFICLFINPFKVVFAEEITEETSIQEVPISEVPNEEPIIEEVLPEVSPTEEPTEKPSETPSPLPEIVPTEIPSEIPSATPVVETDEILEEKTIDEFIMIDLVGKKIDEIYSLINLSEDNVIITYELNEDLEEGLILTQSILVGESYTVESILDLTVSTTSLELVDEASLKLDLMNSFALNKKPEAKETMSTESVGNSNILLNWDSIPYSYEYNWDNSSNCWQWGVWIDGVCYKTPEGEYSTDVRHKMQIYCDNEYVYVHIIYSRDYYARANGDDFQFIVNGQRTRFQISDGSGGSITHSFSSGTNSVVVEHEDSALSGSRVEDSEGYLVVNNDENINNQLEFKIPLSEIARQNSSIDLDNMSMVEFFTPNLMYRGISCAGSSTFGLIILIPITLLIVFKIKRNQKNGKL